MPYINSLDERNYSLVRALQGVEAETSFGLNGDVNYQRTFDGFDEPLVLSVNQSFFYTRLGATQPSIKLPKQLPPKLIPR